MAHANAEISAARVNPNISGAHVNPRLKPIASGHAPMPIASGHAAPMPIASGDAVPMAVAPGHAVPTGRSIAPHAVSQRGWYGGGSPCTGEGAQRRSPQIKWTAPRLRSHALPARGS